MKRPNILFITSDQQHWNTLGVHNPEISTPNLDRLVRQGTYFTRAYCPNPTCTPTRASIITGMYPSQHGAWTLGTKLSEAVHTVGEDFMAAGYRTALVGKAHFQPLRATEEFNSLEAYPILQDLDFWRTFDEPFYGFEHVELARNHTHEAHVGQHYALWMEGKGLMNWRDFFVPPTGTLDPRLRHRWPIPEEYHYDAWIAERAGALLEGYQRSGENFFLWASFFDPHPAYLAPEPWDTMYDPEALTLPEVAPGEHDRNPPHHRMTQQRGSDFSVYRESGEGMHGMHCHLHDRGQLRRDMATYYGMVSLMDKYIGRILDKLDALGLAGDTIVVFTTDHGHLIGHHGLIAKGPFLYEDMIKVPFAVRWPGHVAAGAESPALQSLVDLAPTFLNLTSLPAPRTMTGVDQGAVWKGAAPVARDHILCEHHHEPTTIHLKTRVDERWKITVYFNQSYGELFDLQEDPGEINNLWDDPAWQETKQELLLKFLWAELGKEPMWMPRVAVA
ncbi:MAG: sulfatase-like hydrolase/transferase [bacterium]|nr:sulfatase-like hydrolase/transferase [bacterium]